MVEYTYDAWGSSSVTRTDDTNNIGNLNPFRWKSHYYDNETGMYYINGRYYEDEVGQFITPDYSSINPLVIGGLNPYGLGTSNPLMFGVNGYNCFTSLPLVSDEKSLNLGMPDWLGWTIGGVVIVGLTVATIATASGAAAGFGAMAGALGIGTAATGTTGILAAATIGATMGSIIGGASGAISGGASGAANGFMLGAIFGGLGGAASGGLGTLTPFASPVSNMVFQVGSNAFASGGLSIVQQSILIGQVDWTTVGISTIFGGIGGRFYRVEGVKALSISLGLSVGEEIINWIAEQIKGR